MTRAESWSKEMDRRLRSLRLDPLAYLDDARRTERGVPHNHVGHVPGCYRCELSAEEASR